MCNLKTKAESLSKFPGHLKLNKCCSKIDIRTLSVDSLKSGCTCAGVYLKIFSSHGAEGIPLNVKDSLTLALEILRLLDISVETDGDS